MLLVFYVQKSSKISTLDERCSIFLPQGDSAAHLSLRPDGSAPCSQRRARWLSPGFVGGIPKQKVELEPELFKNKTIKTMNFIDKEIANEKTYRSFETRPHC